MRSHWLPIIFLLCIFITDRINGDTFHYRVLRKICPNGSYHDPIKDRCRRVPGGGEMIKFNLDARCSKGFIGLLSHHKKSRYYFVCRKDAVLTCVCKPKELFSRIRLRCEEKGRRCEKNSREKISENVVENIMEKYRCTMMNGVYDNGQCLLQTTQRTTYHSYEHHNKNFSFENLLNYIQTLRLLMRSSEESWEARNAFSHELFTTTQQPPPLFLINIDDLTTTTQPPLPFLIDIDSLTTTQQPPPSHHIDFTTTPTIMTERPTTKIPKTTPQPTLLPSNFETDLQNWDFNLNFAEPTTKKIVVPENVDVRARATDDDENTTTRSRKIKSKKIIIKKPRTTTEADFEEEELSSEEYLYEYYYDDEPELTLWSNRTDRKTIGKSSLSPVVTKATTLSTTEKLEITTLTEAISESTQSTAATDVSTTTEILSTTSSSENISTTTATTNEENDSTTNSEIISTTADPSAPQNLMYATTTERVEISVDKRADEDMSQESTTSLTSTTEYGGSTTQNPGISTTIQTTIYPSTQSDIVTSTAFSTTYQQAAADLLMTTTRNELSTKFDRNSEETSTKYPIFYGRNANEDDSIFKSEYQDSTTNKEDLITTENISTTTGNIITTTENIITTTENIPKTTESILTTTEDVEEKEKTMKVRSHDENESEMSTTTQNYETTTMPPDESTSMPPDESTTIANSETTTSFKSKIKIDYESTTIETTTTDNVEKSSESSTKISEISTNSPNDETTTQIEELLAENQSTTENLVTTTEIISPTTTRKPKNPLYWRDPAKASDIEYYYEYEEYDENDQKNDKDKNEERGDVKPVKQRRDTSMEYYVESISASREMRAKNPDLYDLVY